MQRYLEQRRRGWWWRCGQARRVAWGELQRERWLVLGMSVRSANEIVFHALRFLRVRHFLPICHSHPSPGGGDILLSMTRYSTCPYPFFKKLLQLELERGEVGVCYKC